MAETGPVWPGHRISVILQLLPAASEEVHPPSYVRSSEVAPCNEPSAILVNLTAVVPLFVTVNVCDEPPDRETVPKLTLSGVKVRPEAGAEAEAKFATTV